MCGCKLLGDEIVEDQGRMLPSLDLSRSGVPPVAAQRWRQAVIEAAAWTHRGSLDD